jgi:hypothetical protein
MNDTMAIRRSCEEGMYLFREGNRVWRVNENGEIDCVTQGATRLLELLYFLQEWTTPSRRRFLNYPLQEWSKRKKPSPSSQNESTQFRDF